MTKPAPQTSARPLFGPDAFTTLDGGSGAAKLSESAVAPLVASARGYATVTPETAKAAVARYGLESLSSKSGRKLRTNAASGDVMMMPWHRLSETAAQAARAKAASHTSLQMRPSAPILVDGRSRKYDMFAGAETELDLHPSTPYSWFADPDAIFFTEGLIKGDAALTGLLRAAGISDTDLAHASAETDPALALRALMETVPAGQRFLIVSFVGVGNWRSRPEWAALALKKKPVWVAFDADASSNLQVWNQASALLEVLDSRKVETAHLVNLDLAHPGAAQAKAGIDDFLASYGRWEDLANALTDLPERPGGKDEGQAGQWRIHPDGLHAQEARPTTGDNGQPGPTRWVDRVDIGARVLREETMRAPTKEEMASGRVLAETGDHEVQVEVEASWKRPTDGQVDRAVVTGPAIVMGYGPKDWDRKGGRIPANLLLHPQWPPEKGLEWLRAVKSHRIEDIDHSVRWKSMGWAPSTGTLPCYIAGNTVVSESGISTDASIVGVNDQILAGASSFGVIAAEEDQDWKAQALADLEAVAGAYLDSGAWTDAPMAATVLGIALRPALPILSRTAAYLVGARRSGKSFTAAQMMSFWQPRPGTWSGDRLPGSAKDTVASTEHSVARASIWVADDLAPSTDRTQALREESAMGDLIRSIHNGAGKRRMNADMTAREVNDPRALLVVTAENEPSVSSVADRVIMMRFGDGALGSRAATDRLEQMLGATGEPARLAGAFIRWHLEKANELSGGWAELVTQVEAQREACVEYANQVISDNGSGDATRHAKMASDVMVTLVRLAQMATDLGASRDLVRRLKMPGLPRLIALQVASAHDAQRATSPGQRALQAVSLLLSSGQGHVASVADPSSAPETESEDADLINARLGWIKQGGDVRPAGPRIGWVVRARDRTTPVVLLDEEGAFTEAQRRYPHLLPHGQKQSSAWGNAWDEQLTVPEDIGWRRHTNGRSVRHTVRVTFGGQQVLGVPVLMDVLVNGPDQDEDEDESGVDSGAHLRVVA